MAWCKGRVGWRAAWRILEAGALVSISISEMDSRPEVQRKGEPVHAHLLLICTRFSYIVLAIFSHNRFLLRSFEQLLQLLSTSNLTAFLSLTR